MDRWIGWRTNTQTGQMDAWTDLGLGRARQGWARLGSKAKWGRAKRVGINEVSWGLAGHIGSRCGLVGLSRALWGWVGLTTAHQVFAVLYGA